jgi:hypothetical protein
MKERESINKARVNERERLGKVLSHGLIRAGAGFKTKALPGKPYLII